MGLSQKGVGLDIIMHQPGVESIKTMVGVIVNETRVWIHRIIASFTVTKYPIILPNVVLRRYVVIVVHHVYGNMVVHQDPTLATNAVQAGGVRVTWTHAKIVLPIPAEDAQRARHKTNVPATPAIPDQTEHPVHNAWPANTKQDKAVSAVTVRQANIRRP